MLGNAFKGAFLLLITLESTGRAVGSDPTPPILETLPNLPSLLKAQPGEAFQPTLTFSTKAQPQRKREDHRIKVNSTETCNKTNGVEARAVRKRNNPFLCFYESFIKRCDNKTKDKYLRYLMSKFFLQDALDETVFGQKKKKNAFNELMNRPWNGRELPQVFNLEIFNVHLHEFPKLSGKNGPSFLTNMENDFLRLKTRGQPPKVGGKFVNLKGFSGGKTMPLNISPLKKNLQDLHEKRNYSLNSYEKERIHTKERNEVLAEYYSKSFDHIGINPMSNLKQETLNTNNGQRVPINSSEKIQQSILDEDRIHRLYMLLNKNTRASGQAPREDGFFGPNTSNLPIAGDFSDDFDTFPTFNKFELSPSEPSKYPNDDIKIQTVMRIHNETSDLRFPKCDEKELPPVNPGNVMLGLNVFMFGLLALAAVLVGVYLVCRTAVRTPANNPALENTAAQRQELPILLQKLDRLSRPPGYSDNA